MPPLPQVAGELEHLGAARAPDPEVGVRLRAVGHDPGHRGEREHVVDRRSGARTAPRPRAAGAWRGPCRACPPGSPASRSPRRRCTPRRRPAPAGRSAGRCPRTSAPSQPCEVRHVDGAAQRRDRVGVLRAQVDVALGGPDGDRRATSIPSISRNGSPSISIRSAKVPLSPSSALHTTNFSSPGRLQHGAPLDPGREAGAAAAAQAGVGDERAQVRRVHLQRAAQPGQPAVGLVLARGERVGHADPGEGQPLLAGQPVDVVGRARARAGGRRPPGRGTRRRTARARRRRRPARRRPGRRRSSTSTSGSSHSMPRDPLRTSVTSRPRRSRLGARARRPPRRRRPSGPRSRPGT